MLIRHSFCAGWGVKIRGYPCSIKIQQKKATLKRNKQTKQTKKIVHVSRLEDSLLTKATGCRACIQSPRQGLCLWLPKSNFRVPGDLLFSVPWGEWGSTSQDLLFDCVWATAWSWAPGPCWEVGALFCPTAPAP